MKQPHHDLKQRCKRNLSNLICVLHISNYISARAHKDHCILQCYTAQPWYPDKSTALCDLTSDWYFPSPPNKICSLIPHCACTRELFFYLWLPHLSVFMESRGACMRGRQTDTLLFFPCLKTAPAAWLQAAWPCHLQPEQQQLLGERGTGDLCKVTYPGSSKQGEAAQIRAGRLPGGRVRQQASGMAERKIFS